MLKRGVIVAVLGMFVALGAAAGRAEDAAGSRKFLATGSNTRIVECDAQHPDGRVVWKYPLGTREGWVLPDGNVLLAVSRCSEYPGGAAVEVTRDLKKVWEYKGTQQELNSVQKTAAGTYVVTEAGPHPRLLELDSSGKVLVEFPLQCQSGNAHMETRMARKLADGSYLVPHLLDFAVKRYDRGGKVLDVIDTTAPGDAGHKVPTWPFTAIRLENGHTLVGLTHANRVAEFDEHGNIVWQLTNEETGGLIKDACGVQRLPNGDTVVNSYAAHANEVKLFEVTPGKKIVWRYKSGDGAGIHHFHLFEVDGQAVPWPPLR